MATLDPSQWLGSVGAEGGAALLAALFARSSQGMAFLDPDLTVRAANESFAQQIGALLEEIIGCPGAEVMPGWPGQADHIYREVRDTGKPWEAKAYPYRFPDHPERGLTYWHISISSVARPDGAFLGWLLLQHEMSESKRAEDETRRLLSTIQRERDQLAALVNSIGDEVWFADTERRFTLANSTAQREFALGASPEGIDIQELVRGLEVLRPDGSPRPMEETPALRALNGEVVRDQDEMVRTPASGELRYRQVTATPVIDADGGIIGSVSVIRDVTEHKQAENALRESEAWFRALFHNANDSIIVRGILPDGSTGRVLAANEVACRRLGYTMDELEKLPPGAFIAAPECRAEIARIRERQRSPGKHAYETVHMAKDGSRIPVEVVSNVFDVGSERVAIFVARDVTERKRAEEALRESEAKYRLLVENQRDLVVKTDADGRFLYVNPAYCRLFDKTESELLGNSYTPQVHPDDLPKVEKAIASLFRPPFECSYEERASTCLGWRWLSWAARAVLDEQGKVSALVGSGRDITERKELEAQLLRTQRLETAGRIAGQVAHDFNNLLGPITAYPEMIARFLPPDHRAQRYCRSIREAATIMGEISSDMLTLSRRGLLEQEPVDLNRVVSQALDMQGGLPPTLEMDLHLSRPLPTLRGSHAQLVRVISNLLTNAREAMQDRGCITLKTESCYLDRSLAAYDLVPVGEYVQLTLSDNGPGIPEEIRSRVFEPFFTTKTRDRKRGAALGLAVVQAIVQDHEGFIDLRSAPGEGTVFQLYFPASHEALTPEVRVELPGGSESLLAVDDDPMQLELCRDLLESLGYRVTTASSGEDGVELVRQQRPDLVILDMVMPGGLSGLETYRRMQAMSPGLRTLAVSGFAETEDAHELRALSGGSFRRKPLSLEQLATAVRAELDRP